MDRPTIGRFAAWLAAAMVAAGGPAHAVDAVGPGGGESGLYPQWNNAFEINLRLDGTFASRNRASRFTNVFADAEWRSALHVNPRLSVQTLVQLEQVREPTGDGFLRNQGLFLRNLYLNYVGEGFSLYGGKYDPGFGTLWSEDLPGLFTNFFTESYKLTEGLGGGGGYVVPTLGWGEHEIAFNLFAFDNSFLSNSAFTRPAFGAFDTERPGRLRFGNGGAGNTRAPTSFSITVNGGEMPQLPGVSYHLAFLRLARGSDATGAEPSRDVYGFAAGMQWSRRLGPEWRLQSAIEGVWFWNVNQGEDENGAPAFGRQRLLTALAALEYDERWSLSAATTLRTDTVRAPGLSQSPTDWLITASLEYLPMPGMRLGIGYRAVREVPLMGDDTRQYTSHTVGVRLRYVFGAPAVVLAQR